MKLKKAQKMSKIHKAPPEDNKYKQSAIAGEEEVPCSCLQVGQSGAVFMSH